MSAPTTSCGRAATTVSTPTGSASLAMSSAGGAGGLQRLVRARWLALAGGERGRSEHDGADETGRSSLDRARVLPREAPQGAVARADSALWRARPGRRKVSRELDKRCSCRASRSAGTKPHSCAGCMEPGQSHEA